MDVPALFSDDSGFFQEHDWNVVSHRKDTPTRRALEAAAVKNQTDGRLALRTNENLEEFFRDGHRHPPWRLRADVGTLSKQVRLGKRG